MIRRAAFRQAREFVIRRLSKREFSMGWFDKVLSTLGIGSAKAAPSSQPQAAPPPEVPVGMPEWPPAAAPVEVVDVVAQLEQRAAANPQKLNWRTSIVDLLKLLDIDSSFSARKEMAAELGCPADKMADSAQMNMWLHKTVLARIAANGGNIPADLLD
jgi:hypothetical protein